MGDFITSHPPGSDGKCGPNCIGSEFYCNIIKQFCDSGLLVMSKVYGNL